MPHAIAFALACAALLQAAEPLPPCLPGWDCNKWVNLNHRTPKYVVGRIIARYPHTPDGLKAALPAIKKAYPGSFIVKGKGDKLALPGVGVIDLIQAAGEGGKAWQWLPVGGGAPPPSAPKGGGGQAPAASKAHGHAPQDSQQPEPAPKPAKEPPALKGPEAPQDKDAAPEPETETPS